MKSDGTKFEAFNAWMQIKEEVGRRLSDFFTEACSQSDGLSQVTRVVLV